MGIDDLKARFDRLLGDRDSLHSALVDLKLGLKDLAQALATTERELTREREDLATAERRGQLAADINDTETLEIARQFTEKHRQRVDLLERKLGVQRDEIAVAEQEYRELAERYKQRTGEATVRPTIDTEDAAFIKAKIDHQAREAAAQAQLEMLKKKMGRN